jgi:hypothetical protein
MSLSTIITRRSNMMLYGVLALFDTQVGKEMSLQNFSHASQ